MQTPFELAGATQATVIVAVQGATGCVRHRAVDAARAGGILLVHLRGLLTRRSTATARSMWLATPPLKNSNVTVFVTGAASIRPREQLAQWLWTPPPRPRSPFLATVNGVAANVVSATISRD